MKIGIKVRNIAGQTGVANIVFSNARYLSQQGHEVTVLVEKKDDRSKELIDHGCTVKTMPSQPFGGYLRRRLFDTWADLQRRFSSFDVVWGHGDSLKQDILSIHNCVHKAHELIYGEPISDKSSTAKLHKLQLENQNWKLVIANSELTKRDLIERYNINPGKIKVIYPGYEGSVTYDAEKGRLFRQGLNIPDNAFVLGVATSGDFNKRGLNLLYEGIMSLDSKILDRLYLVVVGRHSSRDKALFHQCSRFLSGRASLLGFQEDVSPFYSGIDMFVLPSHIEEFGLVVQEAAMAGTPILTSKRVGAAELLGDWEHLLEYPDRDALAAKIKEFLTLSPEEIKSLGDYCRSCFIRNTSDYHNKQATAVLSNISN